MRWGDRSSGRPYRGRADPERLARLQREAQLLAMLQHPHLASVYGFEQADGSAFLVMGLVEGQGLDEMVLGGPLAVDDALDLAAQIAEGLAAAHDRGIIHRDLKPSNVRVTPEGTAKVLDFGLAKADPDSPSGVSSPDITASPTMAAATMAGAILGTAAYMSPEQVRGKSLDRRTDVWSFGCLLYELLTGDRPFTGETITDVLAAIVKDEPEWAALPAELPVRVNELLRRCLQKDLRRRQRDLGDAALQISEAAAGSTADAPPTDTSVATSRLPSISWGAIAGWLAAAAFAALAAFGWMRAPSETTPTPTPTPSWLEIPEPAGDLRFRPWSERAMFTVSPQGDALVVALGGTGGNWLALRRFDTPGFEILEGSENASQFTYSPDGRSIAYVKGSSAVVIPASGGTPLEVCGGCAGNYGIAWSESSELIVVPAWAGGLRVVSVTGGTPVQLTELGRTRGDVAHIYPVALPGGRHVLFSIWQANSEERLAAVVTLSDRTVKIVARGGNRYAYADRQLYFERRGVLFAQPFDLATLETTGKAIAIADNIRRVSADGYAAFGVSANGVLALMRGLDGEPKEVLWVDRDGNTTPALSGCGSFFNPALSPDGRLLALANTVENGGYRVSVHDLAAGTRTEITPDGDNLNPLFTRDGKNLLFISSAFGEYVIASAAVDGSSPPEIFHNTVTYGGPTDWSTDGRRLLFDLQGAGSMDIWMLTAGEDALRPIAVTEATESGATFAPDGEWIAFVSQASGSPEVYIVPADRGASPRRVTQLGVDAAKWSPAGGEILLQKGAAVWALPVQTEPELKVGTPHQLFEVAGIRGPDNHRAEFAVTADGQRFLVLRILEMESRFAHIEIIQNLTELLRRRAAAR